MNKKKRTKVSKFLSFVLRHRPDAVGISVDKAGWASVDELLRGCAQQGKPLSRLELEEIVVTSPKRRFAFSDDGRRIRANQGHSLEVELGYEPSEPPDTLFHGTVREALPSIREKGLVKMDRHHVHLSPDEKSAIAVGGRRGKPIVLVVDAGAMHRAGYVFYCTPNNVWLTGVVPPNFISGLDPA